MKLIAILLLCSRLLLSLTQEYHEEIDCNDEDVFKAVDTALLDYNSRSESGNQFVLYRITEVNKTEEERIFYSIKYQIKEGNCPVQSGKTWQDCDYKEAEQAATGECSTIVGKRDDTKFSVATQTCQITPGSGPIVTSHYDCVGCLHPISPTSPDLEPVLRHAIQHFNNHTDHSHLFALKEVKRAQTQVVAGWNYKVTYTIEQTNCSRKNFLFLTPDCKFLLNGDAGECTDHAHLDLQLRIASFSQECNLLPGKGIRHRLLGGHTEIPVDNPELREYLNHSIAKLNAENNGTFYFKIDTVKKATVQVVAGKLYSIEFMARETTCSKESDKELTEDCEINLLGEILRCSAKVYVVPWLNKIEPTIKCQPQKPVLMLRRPPGFSPFRTVQVEDTMAVAIVSPPPTSMAPIQDEEQDSEKEQGPTREHGRGYGKQIKHGLAHGHKYEHGRGHGKRKHKEKKNGRHNDWRTRLWASSSEDSATSAEIQEKTGRPTPLPSLAQPGVAATFSHFQDLDLIAALMTSVPPTPTQNDDAWIPEVQIEPNSLSFKLIPDFPETSSPKCPGRPWKPLNGMNPTVERKDFHDFDLSDALY